MKSLYSVLRRTLFIALVSGSMMSTLSATEDSGELTGFIQRGMELWNVPGLAVAVVTSDRIDFQQGFGVTAIDAGAEVSIHTLFANASTTKAMVVAGILILVDEGRLSLDDPIVKYIPELHFSDPMLTRQLTVRDLLTHRTGLPSTDFWTFFMDMPLDEQISRFDAVAAEAPLRTRHIYQNTMYEFMGEMVERLSGMRWDNFLTARLWHPIGMNETFGTRAQIPSDLNHVLPYYFLDGQLVLAEWDFPDDLAEAAGSAWTSLHDMSLWAQFLLRDGVTVNGDRLISEAGMQEMFRPQSLIAASDFYPTTALTHPNWLSYGLGWFQQDFQGRKIDFHTGSLTGLIAIIGLDRAADRGVIVLGNRDHAEMRHAVLWQVMDNSPPEQRRDWNQEIFDHYADQAEQEDARWEAFAGKRLKKTKPTLPEQDYTGTYESPLFGELTVALDGRKLVLETGKVTLPMSHWHLDTWLVEYEPWSLREFATFQIGPDGSLSSLVLFGETLGVVAP